MRRFGWEQQRSGTAPPVVVSLHAHHLHLDSKAAACHGPPWSQPPSHSHQDLLPFQWITVGEQVVSQREARTQTVQGQRSMSQEGFQALYCRPTTDGQARGWRSRASQPNPAFSASMLGRHSVDMIVHITRGISSLIKGTDVKEVLNWTLRFDHLTYCLQAFYQTKGFKYLRLGSRSSQNHIFVQSSFSTPCFFLDLLLGSKTK